MSQDEHERAIQRHREHFRRFMDDWPTKRGGSPGDLVALVVIIGVGLVVANSLGYSPAEVWEWLRTQIESLADRWLNG